MIFYKNLVKIKASVTLTFTPDNAVVKIDNQPVELLAGVVTQELEYGDHNLVVTCEGYKDYTETLNITNTDPITKQISLEEIKVNLNLTVDPQDSTVTLNDQQVQLIEGVLNTELKFGNNTLKVEKENFEPQEKSYNITAESQDITETITLTAVSEG